MFGELMFAPPKRATFRFVKMAFALSMLISLGNTNSYFSTAISSNSYGFSAIIFFMAILNFWLRNLVAALLRALNSRLTSFTTSLEASDSSTLEDRELGRGEICCLGDD